MGPIGHTAVSAALGAIVWSATDEPLAIPFAVAAGVLIDADHVEDFFDPGDDRRARYMVRLLHAWEYSALGLIAYLTVWAHPLLLAATLGHLSHLVLDQATNSVHLLGYSLSFRLSRRFRRRQLSPSLFDPESQAFRTLGIPRPWWGRIEPTLWQLYTWRRKGQR